MSESFMFLKNGSLTITVDTLCINGYWEPCRLAWGDRLLDCWTGHMTLCPSATSVAKSNGAVPAFKLHSSN